MTEQLMFAVGAQGSVPLRGLGVTALAALIAGLLMYQPARWSARSSPTESEQADAVLSKQPNVLLIVLDTVRADHLSCYAYPRRTTPGLERLAQEGVLFEEALAPAPWTLPSHASLFTELYSAQHRTERMHPRLDERLTTLTELLHERGYQTVGFSNNSWVSRATNFNQGFDDFEDFRGIWRVWRCVSLLTAMQIYRTFVPAQLHGDRSGGAGITNVAIRRWFDSRHDPSRPFFLFINYLDAHFPYHAPAPFGDRFVESDRRAIATVLRDDPRAQDEADFTPPPIQWDATKWERSPTSTMGRSPTSTRW